jgi:hypothetical protein
MTVRMMARTRTTTTATTTTNLAATVVDVQRAIGAESVVGGLAVAIIAKDKRARLCLRVPDTVFVKRCGERERC